MRLIDADALGLQCVEKINELLKATNIPNISEALGLLYGANQIFHAPTVDAIPIDWLERRLNETAEATAQGDDQTELNNAIFTVLVEWTKATLRKKDGGEHNGEAGR